MSEGLAEAHAPSNALIHLYQRWGSGALAALITGNIQVDRMHLERAANLVLDDQQDQASLDQFARLADGAQREGALLVAQLSHSGRATVAAIHATPLAPSSIPLRLPGVTFGSPRAMLESQIDRVVTQFATAARLARNAGFAGVEIHAAHGYLLSQFLSPLSNARSDHWGGSLENRTRLLMQVLKAVQSECGAHMLVGVKLNATDFQKGAFSFEESIEVARQLDNANVDFLEVTGGTYERLAMTSSSSENSKRFRDESAQVSQIQQEAFFVDFAEAIRKVVKCAVAATGGFRSKTAMNQALTAGAVDLIGVARPLCVDPDCVKSLLLGRAEVLPNDEVSLRLAPFSFAGPSSPFALVRRLNSWGTLNWFSLQLRALANGLESNRKMPLWRALRQYATWERQALEDRQTAHLREETRS